MEVRLKVLLVEDDEEVRAYATLILTEAGFDVDAAGCAEEAEAIIDSGETIGLLIADIVMPGRDGVQLAQALRRAQPDAKVLFTTGYTRHIVSQFVPGAEILDKPYHSDALLHRVRHLLGLEVV